MPFSLQTFSCEEDTSVPQFRNPSTLSLAFPPSQSIVERLEQRQFINRCKSLYGWPELRSEGVDLESKFEECLRGLDYEVVKTEEAIHTCLQKESPGVHVICEEVIHRRKWRFL